MACTTLTGSPGVPRGTLSGAPALRPVVLVILAVALLSPAVTAAAVNLLHILVIVAAVIVGLGAAGVAGLLVSRVRRRLGGAARVRSPLPWAVVPRPRLARAAPPLPPSRPAIERTRELHLHFDGV